MARLSASDAALKRYAKLLERRAKAALKPPRAPRKKKNSYFDQPLFGPGSKNARY